ncbi:MAG: TIGR02677 family protein [Planctomycetota bacterium]
MPEGRLQAFAYLTAERAPLYRAILRVFMEARARFALHLRPAEVAAELRALGKEPEETANLESALRQLEDWGNLEAHQDTAEVGTVEEFYRPRYLYQLTAAGEAAEHAVALFEEELQQTGELKIAALEDVRERLLELLVLARAEVPDRSKVFHTLRGLLDRFEELTRRAQAFMRSLQRSLDLMGLGVEGLLAYKEVLIDYLDRFVRELVVSGAAIARTLGELEAAGTERLLALAAAHDLADALALEGAEGGRVAQEERALAHWRGAWAGLAGWFRRGPDGAPSQSEVLRGLALSAIPSLLAAVAGLNDRRVTRSDRVSDLKTLARWFARTDSDGDAHRLWRVAFGLCPARHLRVSAETLAERSEQPVPPQESWLSAPPIQVAPRLRATGQLQRRGRPNRVIDRSAEKARLAERAAEEARQLEAARRRLATGRRLRLGELHLELGSLEPRAFDLFLDLLGQALSRKVSADAAVVAASTDGSLEVLLEPVGDGSEAVIETSQGTLRGPDHWITIRDALAPAPTDLVEAHA